MNAPNVLAITLLLGLAAAGTLRQRRPAPVAIPQAHVERTTGSHATVPAQDSMEAVIAARHWLDLVDSGRYSASLDSAAPLLRQMAGTADAWRRFLGQARAGFPPGARPSRVVVRYEPGYVAEGAPAGRYVRISFRVGAAGTTLPEFVVLQETSTGWRVAMYGTTDR